jgi:hypothetical protein
MTKAYTIIREKHKYDNITFGQPYWPKKIKIEYMGLKTINTQMGLSNW